MPQQTLLIALVVALSASWGVAAEQVLDARMHHLRSGNEREWSEFPEQAEGASLTLTFAAEPARAPYTLRLRHRDVKQSWRLRMNDHDLGTLPTDENCMTTFWEVPAAALRSGENRLTIEGKGQPSDDVEIGDVRLIDQPRSVALFAARLNVAVTDADTGKPLPARVTVVDEHDSLMTVGAISDKRLAVRPGVIYTADGQAEFGLPAGKYTVYVGRGFEYAVDSKTVSVAAGDRKDLHLAIRRELSLPGYASCDTHVHTLTYSGHGDASIDERLVTLVGEGLELPIATDHNVQIDYRPAIEASGTNGLFTPVVGNEVTTRVGHFNVFPLDPAGPVIDFRGATWKEVFGAIGSDHRRVIVLNHPRDLHGGFRPFDPKRHISLSGEDLDGWELQANAMELVNSGALQSDPWRLVHDWLGLLNAGRRITPVGSSDSHDVARSIVAQGRTYVRCRDDEPGKIDIAEVVESFIAGRVLVSYGLVADIDVNGRYGPGDTVPLSAGELNIKVRVLGPRWSRADEVVLFVNGREARRKSIPAGDAVKGGVKYENTWTMLKPRHDVHLVVVATGPGISGLYWPTAKPYQPDSPEWKPYTLGATGAAYIDADGAAGFSTPRDYALRLVVEAAGDLNSLARRLNEFDEATVIQAAALLQQRGELTDAAVRELSSTSSRDVRLAIRKYLDALNAGAAAR